MSTSWGRAVDAAFYQLPLVTEILRLVQLDVVFVALNFQFFAGVFR